MYLQKCCCHCSTWDSIMTTVEDKTPLFLKTQLPEPSAMEHAQLKRHMTDAAGNHVRRRARVLLVSNQTDPELACKVMEEFNDIAAPARLNLNTGELKFEFFRQCLASVRLTLCRCVTPPSELRRSFVGCVSCPERPLLALLSIPMWKRRWCCIILCFLFGRRDSIRLETRSRTLRTLGTCSSPACPLKNVERRMVAKAVEL